MKQETSQWGKAVKKAVIDHDMTLKQLAEKIGYSNATVSQVVKEDFFDTDEMKILESMKDGYLYSNILLKLYLKSLSNSGRLMYRNVIPYTPEILATLTGHQVGTVEKALDVFKNNNGKYAVERVIRELEEMEAAE